MLDPTSTGLADYDLFDQGLPLQSFEELRKRDGLAWTEEPNGPGFWSVTRYKDIIDVSRDFETFSSQAGHTTIEDVDEDAKELRRSIIETDPPEHMGIRKLIAPAFTPRKVRQYEDMVREIVARYLEAFEAKGSGDWLTEVAKPIPIEVLLRLLDIPTEEQDYLIELTDYLVTGITVGELPADAYGNTTDLRLLPFQSPAAHALYEYGLKMRKIRQENPGDDLVSVLAVGEVEGKPLSETFYKNMFQVLIFAGNETTRTAMAHTALLWEKHPEQFQKLAENPALIPNAIEEILRVASPVIYMRRTATRDAEIAGTQIKAGDKVVTWFASGNYDDSVFDDPYSFDVTRKAPPSVAFGGGGVHTCLGAFIARLELKVLIEEMIKRNMRVSCDGEIEYIKSNFVNGIESLPMRVVKTA